MDPLLHRVLKDPLGFALVQAGRGSSEVALIVAPDNSICNRYCNGDPLWSDCVLCSGYDRRYGSCTSSS
jgi:hypothetical protein